jgi:hypothetical protein
MLVVLNVSGCGTWRTAGAGPRQVIEEEAPSVVRVTRLDGTQVIVRSPAIQGDSIRGREESMAVALTDVQDVELHRTSVPRTLLLLSAVGIGLIVVGLAINGSDISGPIY